MRHSYLFLMMLVSSIAFSQEKCVELFSQVSVANHAVIESEIKNRLEAMVIQQHLIDQKQFETDNQLKQAQENLAKELKELIAISPSHLIKFKKLQNERKEALQVQVAEKNKKKNEKKKLIEETTKNYKAFAPERKLSLDANRSDQVNFSADVKYVASAFKSENEVRIYEVATGKLLHTLTDLIETNSVKFSSDSQNLLVTTQSGTEMCGLYQTLTKKEDEK